MATGFVYICYRINSMKRSANQHIPGRGIGHPEALLIAMSITILLITGFQLYWLKDNYNREKKTVEVRAQSLFRETVRSLQDSVLQRNCRWSLKTVRSPGLKRKMVEGSFGSDCLAYPGRHGLLICLVRKFGMIRFKNYIKGQRDVFIELNGNAEFRGRDSAAQIAFYFRLIPRSERSRKW